MIYSSERLSIHYLTPEDALQLNKLLVSNTERFIRFLPKTLAANRTLESTHSYIKNKMASAKQRTEFVFTIKDRHGIQMTGIIILKNIDWEVKQAEFAYCMGKQFKGKGWMSEAIKASSNFAIETLGLNTLQIISHKSNFGSIKVAENSGFEWKETLPEEYTPLNEPALDMELYELRYEG